MSFKLILVYIIFLVFYRFHLWKLYKHPVVLELWISPCNLVTIFKRGCWKKLYLEKSERVQCKTALPNGNLLVYKEKSFCMSYSAWCYVIFNFVVGFPKFMSLRSQMMGER